MLSTANAPTRHCPPLTNSGGITEIVLPNARSSAIYLPSLAFLSREGVDRWLTWLVPQGVEKSALQQYGFDLLKTRFIYPRNQEQCFAFLRRALIEGNSHTVVGNPGKLTDEQIEQLEQAALIGQCYGLLLRERLSH
jgi:cell division inhibitor SulA